MAQNNKPDQSFDSIANKFEKNIYGSSKGKLRHELLLHHLKKVLNLSERPMRVLDAGGGTGVMTEALLNMSCQVTLNDLSEESLELAKAKMQGRGGVNFVQGEIKHLPDEHYDLVICHAVLEWLQDPMSTLDKLVSMIAPGGHLSLSFFNRDAHRFGNLLYGNFDYVAAGMRHKNTVRLNPNNALPPQQVEHHLANHPVNIIHRAGIRCIHDYLQNRDMQSSHYEQIKQAELEYGTQEPYLWLGKYFHLIVQKSAG